MKKTHEVAPRKNIVNHARMEIYLGKLVVKWVYSQYSQQFASWFEHGWTTSAGRPYLVETTNQEELQYPVRTNACIRVVEMKWIWTKQK